jgi:multidrug efflux pump subunit AcrB
MEELRGRFPEGIDYKIVYDTTPFIQESINEVFHSLRDAVILVALVVLVFLQGWRPAIIPLVAVPVAIVGTFGAMVAADFSLNTLTLFGLVLAIGIVVDDAIVVVEAVEHHIEEGLSPRDAAIRAMEQVSGPVIAVGLVLTAVFVPCAFISGVVGQFFRQFALTIAISTLISAFNSLTLSPALCVLLLKPRKEAGHEVLPRLVYPAAAAFAAWTFAAPWVLERFGDRLPGLPIEPRIAVGLAVAVAGAVVGYLLAGPANGLLARGFRAFHWSFDLLTRGYVGSVSLVLRLSLVMLVVYGGLLWETDRLFQATPTGFIPQQDKGYLLVNVRLPDATSFGVTADAVIRAEKAAHQVAGVNHTVAVAGQSVLLGANAPNFGTLYVMLDEFHHRAGEGLSSDVVTERLKETLGHELAEAEISVFSAPPIEGLGTAGGFKLIVEDRNDQGIGALEAAAERTVEKGSAAGGLKGLFTSFRADTPWRFVDIDRAAAKSMGISMNDLFESLEVYFGSAYVNDFNRFGRTWQVNLQAEGRFRQDTADLKLLKVRNVHGDMVPLASVVGVHSTEGPVMTYRYNLYNAAAVNLEAAQGTSSGEAIRRMEQAANDALENSMHWEWTELALLQSDAGNTAMYAFALAVVLVFLVLAAQYESWALPLAVILVVPMCLLCSLYGIRAAGLDMNIFTQIGFVVLVGLACKNAILIVEFARARHDEGVGVFQATLEACKLRLRPIVMTSLAFILGVVPLMLGTGAGAEMRRTLGTAVFAGMLGVTLFGIVLTPVFFYVIQRAADLIARLRSKGEEASAAPAPPSSLPAH